MECGYVTFNDATDLQVVRHKDAVSDKANRVLYGFPWGKIFKAELFSNICFPEGYWFEDTVMAFVIFPLCRKVATSSVLLYHYRINPDGITSKSRFQNKAVDTYWITEQLLKDRKTLELQNDLYFAEVMLHQIQVNYGRIKSLRSKNIDRAVFILTANLWEQYFSDIKIDSPLVKALTERDFLQYNLILKLSRVSQQVKHYKIFLKKHLVGVRCRVQQQMQQSYFKFPKKQRSGE